MTRVIFSGILLAISIGASVLGVRSWKEKGKLFNNAYLYASDQERSTMDKKPYYRQSAFVFLCVGLIFLLNAISVLLKAESFSLLSIAVAVLTLIYAIASDISIARNKKKTLPIPESFSESQTQTKK